MKRDDVLTILRSLEPVLRSQGISHLYLFGSVAREEAQRGSDVDLAFVVSPEMEERFSLLDQARIGRELGEALGKKVDFIELEYLWPPIAQSVARDQIQVF